jgi:hypothetical protein
VGYNVKIINSKNVKMKKLIYLKYWLATSFLLALACTVYGAEDPAGRTKVTIGTEASFTFFEDEQSMGSSDVVEFGLAFTAPDTITATLYPNFDHDTVEYQNLTVVFSMPAGTVTDPAVSYNSIYSGTFPTLVGPGTWNISRQNATILNGGSTLNLDIYTARINGTFSDAAISTDSIGLFYFRLPGDCNGGNIALAASGDPVAMAAPDSNEVTAIRLNNGIRLDTFMYLGNKPEADTLACPLNITDMPNANNDTPTTDEDNPITIDVLANDNFGSDGASNTAIAIVAQATHGTAVVLTNSTSTPTDDEIRYTPFTDFNGIDIFTYRICDANGDCDEATVTVTVNAVDDNINASNDNVSVPSSTGPVDITVLDNDSYSDSITSFTILTQPLTGGTVAVNDNGTPDDLTDDYIVYTPVDGFTGQITFTYEICDDTGVADCDQATVTLDVSDSACLTEVSCLNSVVIPLDNNCYAAILPSMVMGGLDQCDDQITIVVNYGNGEVDTNQVDRPGFFSYTALGPKNEPICMGTISAEDKIDPQFCCESDVNYEQYGTYRKVNYNTFQGRLDGNDPRFKPSLWSCWQSTNAPFSAFTWPGSGLRIYDTYTFKPAEPGIYSFFIGPEYAPGTLAADFDPVLALFAGDFDPEMPCENIVGFAESTYIPNPLAGEGFFTDGSGFLGSFGLNFNATPDADVFGPWLTRTDPVLRLALKLEADQEYTIVVTSKEVLADGAYDLYAARTEADLPVNQNVLLQTTGTPYPVEMSYHYYNLLCGDADDMILRGTVRFEDEDYLPNYSSYEEPITECTPWNQLNDLLFGVPGSPYSYEVITGLDFPDSVFSAEEFAGQVYIRDVLMLETSPGVLSRKPFVVENCDNFYVNVSDELTEYGDCGYDINEQYDLGGLAFNIAKKIKRTFVVHDYGNGTNSDSCSVDIYFRNPSLLDVILPHYTAFLECDEFNQMPAAHKTPQGYPTPDVTGYPFVETAYDGIVDLTPTQAYCNLAAGYQDKAAVEVCEGTYKFRREWTIYDWCRPGTTVVYNQLVKVGDWTAPGITAPVMNQVGMGSFDCYATGKLPMPELVDNCSSIDEIRLDITVAKVIDGEVQEEVAYYQDVTKSMIVPNLERGDYLATYTATDGCGNAASSVAPFEVVDNIAPMAMCDDVRNISLSNINFSFETGVSWVPADRLDEGSRDNCYPVILNSRRMLSEDCALGEWLEYLDKTLSQALADGDVVLEQGQYLTAWLPEIPFWCCDVATGNEDVKVEMRASEDLGNGQIGLSTKCWMWANVEDKTAPLCFDMQPLEIYCSDLPEDPMDSLFWETNYPIPPDQVFDNCNIGIYTLSFEADIDVCGSGTITRTFSAGDPEETYNPNICTYEIRVSNEHDYTITFPADANLDCSVTGSQPDTIQINEIGCDMLLISTHDEKFTATGDECYKIFRTYRVMNWCEYNGNGDPYIVRRDENCDGTLGNQPVTVIRRPFADERGRMVFIDRDTREDNGIPTTSEIASGAPCWHDPININTGYFRSVQASDYLSEAEDPVTGRNWKPGFWQYTQVVKVYDDKNPTVNVETTNLVFESKDTPTPSDPICGARVQIDYNITDICNAVETDGLVRALLRVNNVGDFDSYEGSLYTTYKDSVVGTDIPIGSHTFRIMAGDGCGNTGMIDIPFTVIDAKAPAPICLDGLAVELMPVDTNNDGTADSKAMQVWGSDFISENNSIFDCSDSITYYIKRAPLPNAAAVISDSLLDLGITVTCSDVNTADNPMLVYVIAEDEAQNRDYCVTRLWVQDNLNPCADVSVKVVEVAGMIATEDDVTVQEVEVYLSGKKAGQSMTGDDGQFYFGNLDYMGDYTLAPKLDKNHLNGVSTYDLVLINKHILGVSKLDSPYKIIAADANRSGSVTTMDLILLRKMILGVQTRFDRNTSWRFVRKDYIFPNPDNPWAETFPELINYNDVDRSMVSADFVAVKIGDVNSTAKANDNQIVSSRSALEKLVVSTNAIELAENQEYRIPFTVHDLTGIEGFQFTISFDKSALRLSDIIYGIAGPANFGTHRVDEGILTTSWNPADAVVEEEEPVLFTLVFQALKNQLLEDYLTLNGSHTKAEAYNEYGELMEVELAITTGDDFNRPFELFQNAPNPFSEETVIPFYMPSSGEAILNIQDASGKQLMVIEQQFDRGMNNITLRKADLPATGIMYYTLITAENKATRKMIVVD